MGVYADTEGVGETSVEVEAAVGAIHVLLPSTGHLTPHKASSE